MAEYRTNIRKKVGAPEAGDIISFLYSPTAQPCTDE